MSLMINNDYSVDESFNDKYNLEINDCVIDIKLYCRDNGLPFSKFDYNDFMNVLKKNINFSKIQIINKDNYVSSDEELEIDSDDNNSDY